MAASFAPSMAIRVACKLKSTDVIDLLSDMFILRGVPDHIRSDDGLKFIAKAVQKWIWADAARTAYMAPGSPWEIGYVESFNARFQDEIPNGDASTMRSGPVPGSGIGCQHRMWWCQPTPLGRLR